MGFHYWNNGGNDYYGHRLLLFITDDDSDPLEKPEPKITQLRIGSWDGSGPYYKSEARPYLEDGTYSVGGKKYQIAPNGPAYNPQPGSYPGYGWSYFELSNQRFAVISASKHTQSNTVSGYIIIMKVIRRKADGKYYQIYAQVQWNKRMGSWDPHYGCYVGSIESAADVLSLGQWVLNYCGIGNDFWEFPEHYWGANYWYAIDNRNAANLSVKVNAYSIQSSYSTDNFHVYWKYPDLPSRQYEWTSIVESGIIPGRIRNAAALSLADAMSNLPEVSANSVANVVELASGLSAFKTAIGSGANSLLRSLVQKGRDLSDPRNVWLSWRYVYNTTKMDLEDYKSVTNRLINMGGAPTFKVHGVGSGDGFQVRCLKQFRSADFNVLDYDTRRLLRTYGFQLSAYNAWDMVPFSFMVDWFAHVGPKLELCENWNRHYDFTPEDTWYSYREQFEHGFIYYRWHGCDPTIPPTYVNKATSKRTISYRLADTVSIFT